jgi:hypothetical protein
MIEILEDVVDTPLIIITIVVALAVIATVIAYRRVPAVRKFLWDFAYRVTGVPNDLQIEQFQQKVWQRYTGSEAVQKSKLGEANLSYEQLFAAEVEYAEREVARQSSNQDAAEKDRALTYLERIVDRIINKGRGILPFNSILFTLLGLQVSVFHIEHYFQEGFSAVLFKLVAAIALMSLVLSSILLLYLFGVYWAEPTEFETFDKEFRHTVAILRKRALVLQAALAFSGGGLICILILTGMASWIGAGSEIYKGLTTARDKNRIIVPIIKQDTDLPMDTIFSFPPYP